MNKKRLFGSLIFSVIILYLIPLTLAEISDDISEGLKDVGDVFEPIFGAILGGEGGEMLFSKILLFMLVAGVIYAVLSTVSFFNEKQGIALFVSIIVSLLGVRFLATEGIVNAILLPYGTLFISLSVGIPFIIFFFVIEKMENPTIRKVGWALFIAVFGILGWIRADEIGKAGFIYIAAIVLATIAFWFDGTIRRFMRGGRIARAEEKVTDVETERALARLADLRQQLGRAAPKDVPRLKGLITKQKKAIKALQSS